MGEVELRARHELRGVAVQKCGNRTRLPGTRTRKFMSARIRRQDSVSSDVCSPFDFFRIHSWPPKGITLTSPSPGDPRTRWSIKAGSRFDAPIIMPPIGEQNCFRLSSPQTNRVSDRRRAPSPPTRITTPAMFLHMTPLSQADARDTSFSLPDGTTESPKGAHSPPRRFERPSSGYNLKTSAARRRLIVCLCRWRRDFGID